MNDKIVSIFPTAVMLVDMSNHSLKSKTLEIIENTELTDHSLLENGVSSFASESILDHPELIDLKKDITNSIKKYTSVGGYSPLKLGNSWFNQMRNGGAVIPHRHEGSVLSGAYYIKAPEGSSNLYFSSPLKPYRMNDIFSTETPFNEYQHCIPCYEDLMVLFPSWLEHYTDKNENDTRTVISFNTTR